jgi:hypothetical protein
MLAELSKHTGDASMTGGVFFTSINADFNS